MHSILFVWFLCVRLLRPNAPRVQTLFSQCHWTALISYKRAKMNHKLAHGCLFLENQSVKEKGKTKNKNKILKKKKKSFKRKMLKGTARSLYCPWKPIPKLRFAYRPFSQSCAAFNELCVYHFQMVQTNRRLHWKFIIHIESRARTLSHSIPN